MRPDIDDVVGRLATLLRRKRFEESFELLKESRDQELLSGRESDAAHYSSLLGSALALSGADEAALEAYVEAERLDPTQVSSSLATARQLLWRLRRIEAARAKAAEIVRAVQEGTSEYLQAQAIIGSAALMMDEREPALGAFTRIADAALMEKQTADECDLTLVEQLVARGMESERTRRYLSVVLDKARRDSHRLVETKVLQLLGRL